MDARKTTSTITDGFKREAVRLVEAGPKSVAQVAPELDIAQRACGQWTGEFGRRSATPAPRECNLVGRASDLKNHGFLRHGISMRFQSIVIHAPEFRITTMCGVFQVSKVGTTHGRIGHRVDVAGYSHALYADMASSVSQRKLRAHGGFESVRNRSLG